MAIKERGKTRRVSTQEGALLRLREKALQGDPRSLDRFIASLRSSTTMVPADIGGARQSAEDGEILAAYAGRSGRDRRAMPKAIPCLRAVRRTTPMDRLLQAILREDLASFVRKVFATVSPGTRYFHNWHVDAIVHQLMRVDAGQSRRLLISQPPRSLKSICVSIAYVAWVLGHNPARRVVVASYSADFAAELHRQFRMVINSAWYAALFPRVKLAKDTGFEIVTTLRRRSLRDLRRRNPDRSRRRHSSSSMIP